MPSSTLTSDYPPQSSSAPGPFPPAYGPPQPIYYAPPPPPAPQPRAERSTSTTGRMEARRPAGVVLAIALPLLGLGIVAGAVHVAVVPLEVLAVWRQPARLSVRSEPSGAEVWLDGRRLSARTPTHTEIERDRIPHVIEVRQPGHATETTTLRFDRTVKLEVSVKLAPTAAAEIVTTPPPAPAVLPYAPPVEAAPAAATKPAHKIKKGKGKRSGKSRAGSARARSGR